MKITSNGWTERRKSMNDPMTALLSSRGALKILCPWGRFGQQLANISWLFAGKIIRMALALTAGILVARFLGAANFGILSFATAFGLLARPLALFQLEGICVREMVRTPEQSSEILGSAFVLSFGAGILSFFMVTGLIFFLRPYDPMTCTMVSIVGLGLVFLPFEIFDYHFQARVNARPVILARTMVLGLISLVKILGLLTHPSLIFFALMTLGEYIFMGLALVCTYRIHGGSLRALRPRFDRMGQLFRDAWPLAMSGMAAAIYLRIDKIMLGQMLGDQAVGIYSAATRLAEAWYFLPVCIMTSIYPVVVKKLDKETTPGQTMQQIYLLMSVTGLLTGVFTCLVSAPLINFLFGPEYAAAAPILAWYTWSGLFVGMAMAKAAYLKAMNYTKIQFISTGAGALVNIGLNLWLIPDYGPMGAVWATLVSYSIEAWLILFCFRTTRNQAKMITKALIFQGSIQAIGAFLKKQSSG